MLSPPEDSQERPPRKIAGLRVSALVEIIFLLAVLLLADGMLLNGDRFAADSPHPFWIVVLLIAAQYGTSEALAAAAFSTAALLIHNVPEQAFNEDLYAWLLRISYNPVLWCLAAVTFGEIRSGHRRLQEHLRAELAAARQQGRSIASAYERLYQIKTTLETLVAGQQRTVGTMYAAARAIERESTQEVLAGIPLLVRSIINPEKFSFYMLKGHTLQIIASEGWSQRDSFQRAFEATSAMFVAIVDKQMLLRINDKADQSILQEEGLLAGPLLDEATGTPFGMLKIERMPFHELTPAAIQNFRIVCDWIGKAYTNAQQREQSQNTVRQAALAKVA
jgi:hypothetical protein